MREDKPLFSALVDWECHNGVPFQEALKGVRVKWADYMRLKSLRSFLKRVYREPDAEKIQEMWAIRDFHLPLKPRPSKYTDEQVDAAYRMKELGMKHKEIQEALDCKAWVVQTLISRGRRRALMARYNDDRS